MSAAECQLKQCYSYTGLTLTTYVRRQRTLRLYVQHLVTFVLSKENFLYSNEFIWIRIGNSGEIL
jgi:hypothetical protein